MSVEIRVPTLGESVTEATIAKWLKKAGDAVDADEPLVELETDKVSLEVPAPSAGVLSEILVEVGSDVAVGARDRPDRGGCRRRRPSPRRPRQKPRSRRWPRAAARRPRPARRRARWRRPSSRRRRRCRPGRPGRAQARGREGHRPRRGPGHRPQGQRHQGRRDRGPGRQGAGRRRAAGAPAGRRRGRQPRSAPARAAGREERVRMTRLRKRIAERLKEAQNTAAMLTTFNEVDMTATIEMRARYQDRVHQEARHQARLHGLLREGRGRGAQGLPRGQCRDRRRRGGLQAPLRHRRRRQHRAGPGRAGGARRRQLCARRHREEDRRPRQARPRRQARHGGPERRHLHHHQWRRVRLDAEHARSSTRPRSASSACTRPSSGRW